MKYIIVTSYFLFLYLMASEDSWNYRRKKGELYSFIILDRWLKTLLTMWVISLILLFIF